MEASDASGNTTHIAEYPVATRFSNPVKRGERRSDAKIIFDRHTDGKHKITTRKLKQAIPCKDVV
jgi:propanediol dehydratase small subunit